jgi:TRAP-type mannitol/chloroaromatic compound transport system permease large subunit
VATPTEAAVIGALGAIICVFISGSMNWKVLKESRYETMKLSCTVVWIIIGGSCFASLYTAIGAVDFLKEVINALPVSKYIILFGIQLSFLVLGILMDPGAIIIIFPQIALWLPKLLIH